MNEQERNTRKTFAGKVTSKTGDKSIKVTFFYKKPHATYGKEIKRKTVLHVHDEKNEAGLGDTVEIMETRPISKMKRFRLMRIIEKAELIQE